MTVARAHAGLAGLPNGGEATVASFQHHGVMVGWSLLCGVPGVIAQLVHTLA